MPDEKINSITSQNVLIVDDRPENLIVLENILESPSINLIKALSGEEALKILLKHDIALILLDVQMPEMDGFETATIIRKAPQTKHIPIIFVTAISKEDKHIFKGYESGGVDYMFKPLDPDILKSKVRVFLELDRKTKILEMKNLELEAAKKNTDNILENVTDGLFLLDRELNIKPQYSLILENIFIQKNLGQYSFIKFLEKKIPDDVKTACEDYLKLMFRDDFKEKSLKDLNPLDEIEINFNNKKENLHTSKILSFSFKRVHSNKKINELIVTTKDITEKLILKKKLEESENLSKRRMKLMFNILHVEPVLLREFMEGAKKELDSIDNELRASEKHDKYKEILEKVFRSIHMIKGNASLLDLKFFVYQAHEFEEKIVAVQNKSQIKGTDFVTLVLKLAEIKNTLFEVDNLIERIKNIQTHFRPKQSYENKLFIQSLGNVINNISGDLNKKVKFVHKDFDLGSIPYQYRLLTKEVLIQLIRNAIYHGIENPNERKKLKKSETGTIVLSSFTNKDHFSYRVRDDGKSLQLKKLKEEAKKIGKWNQSEINTWDDRQIVDLIFTQGISTSTKANKIAGRGVGLTAIKDKINKIDGKIDINFAEGKFCEFTITIPNP